MRNAINIASGLVAAVLLVAAGWLATVPPTVLGDDDGLWVCAPLLVLLALAVQPPVGRRYPWLIAALCVLIAVSGFETLNYQAWHRQHRGLVEDGLRADVGDIEVYVDIHGSSLTVPGTATVAPPLRALSSEERAGVNSGGVSFAQWRPELNISWSDDGGMDGGLSFEAPTVAVRRAVLPIKKNASDFTAGAAAAKYLAAGTTTIAGRWWHFTMPNCAGIISDLQADPPLADGAAPVRIVVQPMLDGSDGSTPACPDTKEAATAEAFAARLAAEPEVTMTFADAHGRAILTAVIPTARLAEALKVRQRLWGRVRRGDVGAPFSPFSYYLRSK